MICIHAMNTQTNATDTSQLMDIAIGTAGSENIIIPDLGTGFIYPSGLSGSSRSPRTWWLPVYIPAGVRVSGHIQAAIASDTVDVCIDLFGGIPPGSWLSAAGVDTYGANAGTSKGVLPTGGAANQPGSWVDVITSTPRPIRGLAVSPQGQDGALNNAAQLTDVGVWDGSAYRVLIPDIPTTTDTSDGVGGNWMNGYWPLEAPLEAGSRLGVRIRSTTASEAKINWLLHGIE